jgi:ComF family protein
VVRTALLEVKYKHVRGLIKPLAAQLTSFVASERVDADAMVAVPLHESRQLERGFNQSALLGEQVSRALHLPFLKNALVRSMPTESQTSMASADQRWQNVHGAFTGGADLGGKRVILIDDVCTTGATLDACAETLKNAGATKVWGFAFAREL